MSKCNLQEFNKLLEEVENDLVSIAKDDLVTTTIDGIASVLEGAELLRKSEGFDASHTIPAAKMKLSGRLKGEVSDHFVVNDSLFTYGRVMSEQEYLDEGEPADGIPIPDELNEQLEFAAKTVMDTIYGMSKYPMPSDVYEKTPGAVISSTTISGKENEAYKLLLEKVGGENNYVVNKNAVLALYAGIVEAAQDMQSNMYLSSTETRELVGDIAPELLKEGNKKQYRVVASKLRNGGTTGTVAAHSIGSSVINKLGLRASKNSPNIKAIQHMTTAMGNLALIVASKSGLINPVHKYSISLRGKQIELDFKDVEPVPLTTKLTSEMLKQINPELGGSKVQTQLAAMMGVEKIGDARLVDLLRLDPTVVDNELTNPDSQGGVYLTRLITPVPNAVSLEEVKAQRELVDQFFDEDTTKAPTTYKPEARNHKVAKTELTVPNAVQQKRLNEKEQAGFSLNDGAKILRKMFYREGKWDSEGLINAIGLKPEKGSEYSATTIASNIASNNSIRDLVNGFVGTFSDGDLGELYFRWFMPINDRTMIRSNVVNPQADKHLARWLLSNTEDKAPVDVSVITDMVNKKPEEVVAQLKSLLEADYEGNYKYVVYMTGIVQAFEGAELEGGKVVSWDKASVVSVVESFQSVMKAEEKLLSDAVRDSGVGHLGHKVNAIANIGKYKAAVNKEIAEFTSDMSMEGDGVTNGTAFLVYQRPVDDGVNKFKERVGLLPANSKAEHLGDVISKKVDGDTYQMTSFKIKQALEDIGNGPVKSVGDNVKLAVKSGLFPLTMDSVEEAMMNGAWRNLSKPGSMTIAYSAEITTIARNTTEEITQKAIDNLLAKNENGEYVVSDKDLKEILGRVNVPEVEQTVLGDIGKTPEAFRQGLRDYTTETMIGEVQFALINQFIGSFSVPAMEGVFTDIYESQQELNRAINNSFGAMYELFNKAFEEEVNKLKTKKVVTQEDKAALVLSLIEMVPTVGKVDGIKREEQLILIKKGLDAVDRGIDTNKQLDVTSATTRYNSGDFAGTKAYLNAFITNAMEDRYKSPGAAASPNSTHMQDNAVINTAIHNVYERTNAMALSIYDASVAGAKTGGVFREYNKVFWEQNLSFNVLEEFVLSIEDAIEGVRGKYPEKAEEWVSNSHSSHDIPEKGKKPKTLVDHYKAISGYYQNAVKNRQSMFNEPTKVMQMGGLFAHYTSDPVAKKAELEERLETALTSLDKVLTKEQKEEAGDRTELTRWARKLGAMKVSQEVLDLAQEVRVTDTGIRTLEGRRLSSKFTPVGKPTKVPEKIEPVTSTPTELTKEINTLSTTIVQKVVELMDVHKDEALAKRVREVLKKEMGMHQSDNTLTTSILQKILEGCE